MNDVKWEETTVTIFEQTDVTKTQPEDASILEPYLCNQCGFETHLKVNLKQHKRNKCLTNNVAPKTSHRCKNCQFKTFSLLVLLKHECTPQKKQKRKNTRRFLIKSRDLHFVTRTIDGSLRYDCAQCAYTSPKKCNLIYHIKYQHVRPEYVNFMKCSHCTYETKKRGHLNRHISTQHPPIQKSRQNTNNWYNCEQCCYGSNKQAMLQRHLSHHVSEEDVKWYSCRQCPYRKINKNLVSSHEKRKHGVMGNEVEVKWATCEICSYKAKRMCHLKEHIQSKHLKLKFYCNDCSFASSWKRALRNHVLRAHAQ